MVRKTRLTEKQKGQIEVYRTSGAKPKSVSQSDTDAGSDWVADQIDRECSALADMLKSKNAAYGNSALDPIRIFSQADAVEQIRVRIDDKLSRLKRGSAAGEDVIIDLLGYLVLLRIATRQQAGSEVKS